MHSVFSVEPSIWGVKLRRTSHDEEPLSEPGQLPPLPAADPGQGDRLPAPPEFQSLALTLAELALPLGPAAVVIPGGGPRGLLAVTQGSAEGGGASDQVDLGVIFIVVL